ncbi:DUF4384 domain-containing protein [Sulfurovum sp. bin170]|uniref:C1 family peptidase n=1 Tax=Sulfurovum sp. bin170 TaxID=2695268 RepID=UPI0013DFB809|nr:C1 family peptidase [Sulfurovum sp. bin170]NEW61165.1 DUF4384 domain-containing protein [Sulfurovum sp. bin170]
MRKILSLILTLTTLSFTQTYHKGLIFDDEAYQNIPKTAKLLTRDFESLPTAVSLQPYAPTVGSQGATGTCTAWATAYGARTILESITNNREYSPKTDSSVFSPSYVYNQIRTRQGCDGGTNIGRALDLIQNQGVAKLSRFRFDCNKPITQMDRNHASAYKIKDFKTLFSINDTEKIQPVKKALSQKKPVIIGMRTPDSFDHAKQLWQPAQGDYHQPNLGGHAMVVVGYDDNQEGGSFQLMNSWGKRWGEDGFTWIRYSDFGHFVREAYEMIPNPPPQEPTRLGGALKFVDSNGNEMSATYSHNSNLYKMNQPYKTGTRFNFFIQNAQPAYLYAFGLDAQNKVSTIFPHDSRISAFLGYKNSSIAFPDEHSHIRMDNHIGKDYFIVLYSKEKLNIDAIKSSFANRQGSVRGRLRAVLGEGLIESGKINFSQSMIKFNYDSGRGVKVKSKDSIIAVIIEFDHIGENR